MTKTTDLAHKIFELCARVRRKRPLIHVVTNFVVMNQTANALLALGAAPTMSWAKEDTDYMSAVSDGLCVNMGTPVTERIEVMKDLMRLAEKRRKPIVLDPVGSGAGPYRTGIAKELLLLAPDKIIRGNASEICSLLGQDYTTKGVENTLALEEAKQILIGHGRTHSRTAGAKTAKAKIADKKPAGVVDTDPGVSAILQFACAVIVSGQKDLVLGRERSITLENGSNLMNDVTGTGCILSAVTAAFYAVSDNGFEAAVAATSVVGIAGELAAKKAAGPGTFMAHFLDSLYAIDQDTIQNHLRAEFKGITI